MRRGSTIQVTAAARARIVELRAAINRYLAEHTQTAKPFTWTKDPE
jgi:hypothetical protein